MKKVFAILLISAAISACGGGSKSGGGADSTAAADQTAKSAQPNADTSAGKTGAADAGAAAPAIKLMASLDCNTCHKADVKVVGPAFKDIAAKYPPTDANIDTLANKVIKGGKGHWGDIAMSAHPSLAVGDAKTIVKYILSLHK
ncbi:cytochrome c class I [Mucilaginibacter sp. BJC16-A38]|uniref:c-type cytochrome n=1 Tax=Mucilaginibacter phenanthrenivorans TaxID=1234842 RepID=UPI002156F75A|nr:c-type cytochrome [Mucilaginibacter phenanthrenivorans]MCR8559956.1 cytochrome c class I [Mucilaginibacter phenanthrenivorans]